MLCKAIISHFCTFNMHLDLKQLVQLVNAINRQCNKIISLFNSKHSTVFLNLFFSFVFDRQYTWIYKNINNLNIKHFPGGRVIYNIMFKYSPSYSFHSKWDTNRNYRGKLNNVLRKGQRAKMNLIIKDYVLYIKDYFHVRSYLTQWYHTKNTFHHRTILDSVRSRILW